MESNTRGVSDVTEHGNPLGSGTVQGGKRNALLERLTQGTRPSSMEIGARAVARRHPEHLARQVLPTGEIHLGPHCTWKNHENLLQIGAMGAGRRGMENPSGAGIQI